MGLLSKGTPLDWEDSIPYQKHIHEHGIQQFLNSYHRLKDRNNDVFLWGDEIEYMVLQLKDDCVKVVLRASDILEELADHSEETVFHPEYAQYMVEATPGQPYANFSDDLVHVEANMHLRRKLIQGVLKPNEYLVALCSFPLLGVNDFAIPMGSLRGSVANSEFVPDEVTNQHPRFPCLTRNIRLRRGSNVCITVPMFKDENTHTRFENDVEEPVSQSDQDVDRLLRKDSKEVK